MFDALEFDWFILLLRLLFIFLLYFFLFQVVRVTTRELIALGTRTDASGPVSRPAGGRLVMVDGAESGVPPGASFGLEPVTRIGRRPECTIALDEPFVSAEHAELAYDNGRWWLRDLGSTNGTYLNGVPVGVATGVRPGDVVQFGRIKLQFVP
ncbi:MAG: FHA domain-containing protein [Chloroflexota bacterium]|nr:FHA domain-containing protein [Chloroflexota bacterium]